MDEIQGLDQSTEVTTSAPDASASAPATQSTPNERTFRQHEVNEIVGRAKKEAAESTRRKYEQEPQYTQQRYTEQAPAHQDNRSPAMPEDTIRRLAAEEAQRLRNEWVQDSQAKHETSEAQRIVQNFWNKIAPGKEDYEDFDAVTSHIEYARFPNVVQILSEHVENAHDVLYELGKDRFKMAQLEQLSQMSPKDALVQARRLAESIQNNKQAARTRTPKQPLSQLRPSNTGTDNGVMSVRDYRMKYRG